MEIQWLEVLKWIGIALAAGFIGYFGRYLAMLIIGRLHKKKPGETPTAETKQAPLSQGSTLEESRLKLEKKKSKAEAKRIKKEKK